MKRDPIDSTRVIAQTLALLPRIQSCPQRVIVVNAPAHAGKTALIDAWTTAEQLCGRFPVNYDAGQGCPVFDLRALKDVDGAALDNADLWTIVPPLPALLRVPRLLLTTTTSKRAAPAWLRWLVAQPDTLLLRVERDESAVPAPLRFPGKPSYEVQMLGKWE